MMWSADAEHLEGLREVRQHSDPNLRFYAAMGLAFNGDLSGASLLFDYARTTQRNRSAIRRRYNKVGPDPVFYILVATLSMGEEGEAALIGFLDHKQEDIRDRAILMILLLELANGRRDPRRLIAALSSEHPDIRFKGGWALELWQDEQAYAAMVQQVFNARGYQVADYTLEEVESFAAVLAHQDSRCERRVLLYYGT